MNIASRDFQHQFVKSLFDSAFSWETSEEDGLIMRFKDGEKRADLVFRHAYESRGYDLIFPYLNRKESEPFYVGIHGMGINVIAVVEDFLESCWREILEEVWARVFRLRGEERCHRFEMLAALSKGQVFP